MKNICEKHKCEMILKNEDHGKTRYVCPECEKEKEKMLSDMVKDIPKITGPIFKKL